MTRPAPGRPHSRRFCVLMVNACHHPKQLNLNLGGRNGTSSSAFRRPSSSSSSKLKLNAQQRICKPFSISHALDANQEYMVKNMTSFSPFLLNSIHREAVRKTNHGVLGVFPHRKRVDRDVDKAIRSSRPTPTKPGSPWCRSVARRGAAVTMTGSAR